MHDTWQGPAFTNALKQSTEQGCIFSWTSTRLVAVDVDPKREVMLRLDFTTYADTSDCIISFYFLPTPKPMYDTILRLFYVRYDLTSCSSTIRSLGSFVYDINL